MFSLLVALIFLAFVSLGLPDSLLGAAWESIRADMNMPVWAQGILSVIISCCTIVSSLCSNFATKKLGTGPVTVFSVLLTALAMIAFSFCKKFWLLCLCAVPYGLGAGAVDAALNNYVALHYSSRVMNWLHCFWGVGVSVSPYIMGACIAKGSWQQGYLVVGCVQMAIFALLLFSLPLWKKQQDQKPVVQHSTREALKSKGVWLVLLTFFCYCALESTALQWASTYLVLHKGVEKQTAATFATLFCSGMTVGRFVSGIFSGKLGDKTLIRIGGAIVSVGIVLLFLPVGNLFAYTALVLIGLGCAPIYPAIIHSTPANFGEENSQALVGVQMAFAYVGSTCMPPLFGLLAETSVWALPAFLAVLCVGMVVLSETLNHKMKSVQ